MKWLVGIAVWVALSGLGYFALWRNHRQDKRKFPEWFPLQAVTRNINRPSAIELESMEYDKERGLHMQMRHPMFFALCAEVVGFFRESGAENYVEFGLCHSSGETFTVTIQRGGGETPGQQAKMLRGRVAELEAAQIREQGE